MPIPLPNISQDYLTDDSQQNFHIFRSIAKEPVTSSNRDISECERENLVILNASKTQSFHSFIRQVDAFHQTTFPSSLITLSLVLTLFILTLHHEFWQEISGITSLEILWKSTSLEVDVPHCFAFPVPFRALPYMGYAYYMWASHQFVSSFPLF